jgi:hypothetical protein
MLKPTLLKQLGLTSALAMSLTSCSLHSRQEWAKIQEHGLIPYLANKKSSPRPSNPSPVRVTEPQQMVASNNKAATSTTPLTSSYQPSVPSTSSKLSTAPTQSISLPPPSEMNAESLPMATLVPGLDGYVRTPYTDPPRLVDVRGTSAGEKVVCPFSRKPFLVPAASVATDTAVAGTSLEPAAGSTLEPSTPPLPGVNGLSPQIPQISADLSTPSLAQLNNSTPLPTQPTQVAQNSVTLPDVPPAPVADNKLPSNPLSNAPVPEVKANNVTPGNKTEAETQLPYGTAIVGRPGFVNSPYAAKHQLVDVTGLPTGMEVKCPYSGKLFRVPPMTNGQ